MSNDLNGLRIAILAARGVEEVELVQPRKAVTDAGATADLLSLKAGTIQAVSGDIEPTEKYVVDRVVADASVDEYDGLLLPGGAVNPDTLRQDSTAVGFVRDFVASGKPVAVICHGPWTLVEADAVRGRTITSYPSVATDLRNAGANWMDREVVVDGNLISSRKPDDLPAFCTEVVNVLAASQRPA